MDSKEDDEIIFKEALKIINSNKLKASNLRNHILNLNNNIYTNNLNMQIIQFLAEFEYDLKTLIELLNDFKNKTQINSQNKLKKLSSEIDSLKKELKLIKKENNNLKKINKNKNNKNIMNKSNYIPKTIFKDNEIKNLVKNLIDKKVNKNKNDNINNNAVIDEYKNNEISSMKQNFSQINFYPYKINTSNNYNNKKIFYDYNSFLINLKKNNSNFDNNSYNLNNSNVIKYDNYKFNNKKEFKKTVMNNFQNAKRAQSFNSKIIYNKNKFFNEEKKENMINEIFQNEKILNSLKAQFGNDIEDKLLNEDIDFDLLQNIEELIQKVKKYYYMTPKNKNIQKLKKNIDYNHLNLKVPRRYSTKKNNSSITKLIISP